MQQKAIREEVCKHRGFRSGVEREAKETEQMYQSRVEFGGVTKKKTHLAGAIAFISLILETHMAALTAA